MKKETKVRDTRGFIRLSHCLSEKKSKSSSQSSKIKPKPKPKRPDPPVASITAYRPAVSAEKEADFMSSILGNMDNIVPDPLPQRASRKRKPSPTSDSEAELAHTSYPPKILRRILFGWTRRRFFCNRERGTFEPKQAGTNGRRQRDSCKRRFCQPRCLQLG